MKWKCLVLLGALVGVGCSGGGNAPADGGSGTDAGTDAGSPVDAGYDTTCSAPGTPGNALGVGKFCSPGGDQCSTNSKAIFCTVDFDATANTWFCTTPCRCDTDCGDGAICTSGQSDGGGPKGCVPVKCAGTNPVGTPLCPFPDGGTPGDGG